MDPACVPGPRMCNAMTAPFVLHAYLVEEAIPSTWTESLIMAKWGRETCSPKQKGKKNTVLPRWEERSCAEQNAVMATTIHIGSTLLSGYGAPGRFRLPLILPSQPSVQQRAEYKAGPHLVWQENALVQHRREPTWDGPSPKVFSKDSRGWEAGQRLGQCKKILQLRHWLYFSSSSRST